MPYVIRVMVYLFCICLKKLNVYVLQLLTVEMESNIFPIPQCQSLKFKIPAFYPKTIKLTLNWMLTNSNSPSILSKFVVVQVNLHITIHVSAGPTAFLISRKNICLRHSQNLSHCNRLFIKRIFIHSIIMSFSFTKLSQMGLLHMVSNK